MFSIEASCKAKTFMLQFMYEFSTNASVLNARCAILACMNVEENNRVRMSDDEDDDGGSKNG
ncbi:MAG: hypothetical protein WA421_14840 [Nitrososphaeraceae archaeon]